MNGLGRLCNNGYENQSVSEESTSLFTSQREKSLHGKFQNAKIKAGQCISEAHVESFVHKLDAFPP
jgi:hypothetical protein